MRSTVSRHVVAIAILNLCMPFLDFIYGLSVDTNNKFDWYAPYFLRHEFLGDYARAVAIALLTYALLAVSRRLSGAWILSSALIVGAADGLYTTVWWEIARYHYFPDSWFDEMLLFHIPEMAIAALLPATLFWQLFRFPWGRAFIDHPEQRGREPPDETGSATT